MVTGIELKNGVGSLEFGTDSFQRPCIYYVNEKLQKQVTKLEDCFLLLNELQEVYDANEIYNDFLSIADKVKKKIDKDLIIKIEELGEKYGTKVVIVFEVLYMHMVLAEQLYKHLGKERICIRLYYLFFEDYTISHCVHMLDDVSEEQLKKLCKEKEIMA